MRCQLLFWFGHHSSDLRHVTQLCFLAGNLARLAGGLRDGTNIQHYPAKSVWVKLKYFDMLDMILLTDLVTHGCFCLVLSRCCCKASAAACFGRVVCLLRRWRGEGLVFICLGFLFETIGTRGDSFLVEWSCMDLASVFKGNREHPSPLGLCQIKKSIYVTSEKSKLQTSFCQQCNAAHSPLRMHERSWGTGTPQSTKGLPNTLQPCAPTFHLSLQLPEVTFSTFCPARD